MNDSAMTLWYTKPAAEWVEALPVGNGRLGAMVFGGPACERLALNEDTLWAGGPRQWDNPDAFGILPRVRRVLAVGDYVEAESLCKLMQGPFTESYLPMGDLYLDFAGHDDVADYRRELDIATGVTRVSYRVGDATFTREVFVSAVDQVVVVRLACDSPGGLNFTARLESQLPHTVAPRLGGEGAVLRGKAPKHAEPSYRQDIANPVIFDESPGGRGMTFEMHLVAVDDDGETVFGEDGDLAVAGATTVTVLLSAATSFNGPDRCPGREGRDPSVRATSDLVAALAWSYDAMLARHIDDHRRLFDRVTLELPVTPAADLPTDERLAGLHGAKEGDPQLAGLFFQYGRYLLMASSRPGCQPANLQGIWNDQLRPPWSCNWTININTQMNYWPAETTNLAACHLPLLDLVEELASSGRATARTNYGCGGWTAHHNTDIWRQSGPVGDWGWGNPVWANWPMGGAWLARHVWEHYAFSGDEDFLRHRGYPLIRGAAEFCLDWLIEDDAGRLVTAPSTSPENSFIIDEEGNRCSVSVASTMDMAITWDVFTHCIEAAEILGVDAGFGAELAAARQRLYPPKIGRHGQLQEWYRDWDDPTDHHRHVSHLFGLHPGKQITVRGTPELAAAAKRSLELRGDGGTGWSKAWKINFWARFEDGDHARKMLFEALADNTYPNLFDAHPPFQIDGNFGAAAGIAEMLLQSHIRSAGPLSPWEVHLLPALPTAWGEGKVTGLRARGGFEVDITWREGTLTEATIRASLDGPCVVRHGERVVTFDTRPGGAYDLDGELTVREE